MIPHEQVESGELARINNNRQNFINPQKWIGVFESLRIETPVIDTKAKRPVFLSDDDAVGSIRTYTLIGF